MPKPNRVQIIKYGPPPPELPVFGKVKPEDVSFIGRTNYVASLEEKKFIFGIKRVDRRRHLYIIGKSGVGKTKLLDYIRKSNIVAGEAGGITQHIGAYEVKLENGKSITFLDTPGHEAFTAMRARGAKVTDIVIIVIAADDNVMPQTREAINHALAAQSPIVFAINKIDKPEADVNRTKQELSTQLNITTEDWGGKAIAVPVSAKDGKGINELLDMLVLLSETEANNLKANPQAPAIGTVIEAKVDKGAGPVATILIQNGTLRVGDQLCFNGDIYGKVKALKNYRGEVIEAAGPSSPARILGLKSLPEVGDMLAVGEGERIKAKKAGAVAVSTMKAPVGSEEADENVVKFNIIIKSDVLGSAEAIEESLMKLNNEKIKVKIIARGLGNINEGDIKRAQDSSARILGFNVRLQPNAETLVRESGVSVNLYNIIYDLIKYVKSEMQALVKPDIVRRDLGRLKVLAIFRTENNHQVVGGKVLDGYLENNANVEVMRDKDIICTGKLTKIQSGKQDVSRVETNQECGLKFEGKPLVQVGDIFNVYTEEEVVTKV